MVLGCTRPLRRGGAWQTTCSPAPPASAVCALRVVRVLACAGAQARSCARADLPRGGERVELRARTPPALPCGARAAGVVP